MNPFFFLTLTVSACAIAHYSIVFLEPSRASWFKATILGVSLVIGSNLANWAGFNPTPLLEWIVYIAVASGYAWSLFKLKPLNSVTVGTCYVAGSYVLARTVHLGLSAFST